MGNKLDSDVMWVLHRQERNASLFMTRQTDELTNLTTGRLHKVKERLLCNLRAQINTSQSSLCTETESGANKETGVLSGVVCERVKTTLTLKVSLFIAARRFGQSSKLFT